MNQYYIEMTAPANWEADYNEQTIYSSEMSEINSNDSYSIVGDAQYDLELTPVDSRVPRVQSGKITKNYNQVPAASRPGRKPRQADEELSQQELERRNRRRARNREAAQRQRERRLNKVDNLEREVNTLTSENSNLLSENEQLKKELEHLKFQLQMQMKSKPNKPLAVLNTQIATTKSRLAPVQPITIVPDNTNANQCNIPDDLFTPHGSFVLKTPAELKMINTFDFPQIACEPLPKTERIESFSDILYQL
jgi:flagellar biosynthesis GTPase FlhF